MTWTVRHGVKFSAVEFSLRGGGGGGKKQTNMCEEHSPNKMLELSGKNIRSVKRILLELKD